LIKVLQYPTPQKGKGGLHQFFLNTLKYIDKSKFQFGFLALSKEPLDLHEDVVKYGFKVHYIPLFAEGNEELFTCDLNAILDEGYDAVHLHTSFWRGFLIERVAVKRGIPVIIVHAHSTNVLPKDGEDHEKLTLIHKKNKAEFSAQLATHFCACSKAAGEWLFGEQIPREKIRVLNNAIEVEKFSYNPDTRKKYREELGLKKSFVVGHIGRFGYPKNHEMLIDIMSRVCGIIPNAKLLLIGTGEFHKGIMEKVKALGLSDDVLFLGHRDDIPELLQAMDVFVLPSRFEGLPYTLIEAQAAGLRCLASEFVTNEAGITSNIEFLPYDNDMWVAKIAEIANSNYLRVNMSADIAKAGYDIKEQVKVLEKIYANEL
jgi:glycosyltransferase involved in cell wall biosynthesis